MNLIMSGAIAIAIYAGRLGRTFDPHVRNLHVNGTNNNHVCSKRAHWYCGVLLIGGVLLIRGVLLTPT